MRARAVEALVWWALAYGIWLVSLSAISLQEYVVAALCALPCGVAAAGARWAIREAWRPRLVWLWPAVVVPVALAVDAVQVLAAPWRPGQPGGWFESVPGPAVGDGSEARFWRAWATALVTVTPGGIVLDADPETGELLVHSLASRGPRLQRLVAR